MKYLDFEKHIKNELGNSKEPVQMDTLLATLNLGKEQPKRKGFAFWMLLPFLLLTISFAAWKFTDNQSNADSELLSQDVIEFNEKLTAEINKKNDEKSIIGANDINQNQDKNNNENLSNQDVLLENDNEAQLKNTPTITSKTTLINASGLDNLTKGVLIETNFNSINERQNADLNTSSSIDQESVSSTDFKFTNSSGSMVTPTKPTAKITRDLLNVENLTNAIDGIDIGDIDGKLFKRMKINCPSFDNSGWHLALIPEVGIFKPFKTLEYNSPEISTAFNERIKSEQTLEGLEIALHGMLVRDNVPLYLKAGISYSRISERMELKYEYTEMDTTIGIISSTVSSNGDTITHIYGDIITETTFKGSNRQHHYIHLFDVPISVGYSTYIAGLDVGIEAGIRVNFMTRATGNLLVSGNEYSNLSLNKLFKNRVGISYAGGLMIGRNFGRFGDFYIAPRFTYYPNNFNSQNNNINQKYFNIGLNAGIVYKIN